MKSKLIPLRRFLTILLLVAVIAPLAISQGRTDDSNRGPANIGDGIPEAALLTERGRQLADQLLRLRRTEATLGPKHPSLPGVREEIQRVEEQLQAWLPKAEEESPIAAQLPEMNGNDLRELILRMSVKIQRLEQRVDALEKRLEVF